MTTIPLLTAFPAAPDSATDTPQEFSTKADAFVNHQSSVFEPEVNATVAAMNTVAGEITTSEANTLQSELNAAASANFLGTWDSVTAYTVPSSVEKNGTVYAALLPSTNQDPATETTYWLPINYTASASTTFTNKTLDDITNFIGANHIHYPVRNESGSTILAGTVVAASGTQPGTDYIEIVTVTDPQTQTALGIVHSDILTNASGLCINTGVVNDHVDTSGWNEGTILYPNTTGGMTSTQPTSGQYQACAVVTRSHATQGTLLCEFSEPKKISSTTQKGYVQLVDDLATDDATKAVTAAQAKVLQDTKLDISNSFSFKNKLINGDFRINQRAYVSGTATTSANEYTIDRWRVVTLGESLTFSTTAGATTITAPTNGVEQVIENNNIQGGSFYLSYTGTATAIVYESSDNVTYSTVTPTAGVYTITGGYYVKIKLSAGTASNVQFEEGSVATPFEQRPIGLELSLCQRYFYKIVDWQANNSGGAGGVNRDTHYSTYVYPTEMRVVPSPSNLTSVDIDVLGALVSSLNLTAKHINGFSTATTVPFGRYRISVDLNSEL